MKRNGKVLNAQQVKEGRALIRWGAAGVLPRALLGRGPAFAAQFAKIANMVDPDGFITKTEVCMLIRAAYFGPAEAEKMASELEEMAAEREANRPPYAAWTYDAETAACRRLAAAIRAVSSS